jgi:hypothetical protein
MDGLDAVRATVAAAAEGHGIALGPAPAAWTVRDVPLAPFPARLRLDAERALLWHDVVAAEVVPPVAVEAVVDAIPLPRPEVRLMVGEARWMVALSYPLPFPDVTVAEVVGLLSAGALYATALAVDLDGHVGKRWRASLEAYGFVPGAGFGHDPRDLLRRARAVPWPAIGQ